MTLTKLMGHVDWSQMEETFGGDIRHVTRWTCPLLESIGRADRDDNGIAPNIVHRETGINLRSLWMIAEVADNHDPSLELCRPIHARWRQWMLDQMRKAHNQ